MAASVRIVVLIFRNVEQRAGCAHDGELERNGVYYRSRHFSALKSIKWCMNFDTELIFSEDNMVLPCSVIPLAQVSVAGHASASRAISIHSSNVWGLTPSATADPWTIVGYGSDIYEMGIQGSGRANRR